MKVTKRSGESGPSKDGKDKFARDKTKDGDKSKKETSHITCYKCGEKGHMAKDCSKLNEQPTHS